MKHHAYGRAQGLGPRLDGANRGGEPVMTPDASAHDIVIPEEVRQWLEPVLHQIRRSQSGEEMDMDAEKLGDGLKVQNPHMNGCPELSRRL